MGSEGGWIGSVHPLEKFYVPVFSPYALPIIPSTILHNPQPAIFRPFLLLYPPLIPLTCSQNRHTSRDPLSLPVTALVPQTRTPPVSPVFSGSLTARSPPKPRKSTQTGPNPQAHMPRTNTTHKYRTYIPHPISPLNPFHTWYALPIHPAPDSRPARPLSRPQMNPSISPTHPSHLFLTHMAGIHGRYSHSVSPFTPPSYEK